jgi:hypothetical protein
MCVPTQIIPASTKLVEWVPLGSGFNLLFCVFSGNCKQNWITAVYDCSQLLTVVIQSYYCLEAMYYQHSYDFVRKLATAMLHLHH